MKWFKKHQVDILFFGIVGTGMLFLCWLFLWMQVFSPLAKGLRAMGY